MMIAIEEGSEANLVFARHAVKVLAAGCQIQRLEIALAK